MKNLANITQVNYDFCGIPFHQPSIEDIAAKIPNEDDLFFVLNIFHIDLQRFLPENMDVQLSSIQIFLFLLQNKDLIKMTDAQYATVFAFLNLVFPTCEIAFGEAEIILTDNERDVVCIMDDKIFQRFCRLITKFFRLDLLMGAREDVFNPASDEAEKIKKKLDEAHKKIAKQNGEQAKKPFIENYISILSVGLRLSPREICKWTIFNLFSQFERYTKQLEWEMDIKCRLAGGDPKNHPDNWMEFM